MTAPHGRAPALATGLAVVAVLVGGVVSIADVRAEEERREAARAERAYRDAVRPIAEKVFDQVQPLIEADDQFDDRANGGFTAWQDVSTGAKAVEALTARNDELVSLDIPAGAAAEGEDLVSGLASLLRAARLYADLPFGPDAGGDLGESARTASLRMDVGVRTWASAVDRLYGDDAPAVPEREGKAVRRPLSRGSYLFAASRLCGRADVRERAIPEDPADVAAARRAARDSGVVLRDLVRGLLAVPVPGSDRATVERTIAVPLRDVGRAADAFDALAAALGARDPAGIERAFDQLGEAVSAAQRVESGFRSLGSTACVYYFDR